MSLQNFKKYIQSKNLLTTELEKCFQEFKGLKENYKPIIDKMPFGKYKNLTFSEIHKIDPNYIDWLKNNSEMLNNVKGLEKALNSFESLVRPIGLSQARKFSQDANDAQDNFLNFKK